MLEINGTLLKKKWKSILSLINHILNWQVFLRTRMDVHLREIFSWGTELKTLEDSVPPYPRFRDFCITRVGSADRKGSHDSLQKKSRKTYFWSSFLPFSCCVSSVQLHSSHHFGKIERIWFFFIMVSIFVHLYPSFLSLIFMFNAKTWFSTWGFGAVSVSIRDETIVNFIIPRV